MIKQDYYNLKLKQKCRKLKQEKPAVPRKEMGIPRIISRLVTDTGFEFQGGHTRRNKKQTNAKMTKNKKESGDNEKNPKRIQTLKTKVVFALGLIFYENVKNGGLLDSMKVLRPRQNLF